MNPRSLNAVAVPSAILIEAGANQGKLEENVSEKYMGREGVSVLQKKKGGKQELLRKEGRGDRQRQTETETETETEKERQRERERERKEREKRDLYILQGICLAFPFLSL